MLPQTHGAIEAASGVRDLRELTVVVHPVSLQAAAYGPRPRDGLQAKFSIPFLTAFTLLCGPPRVESFDTVDPDAVVLAQRIEVRTDGSLLESECVLASDGREVARVEAALGSPQRPMDARALREKVAGLAGERLVEALEDLERPAEELLELAGLGRPTAGCRSPATSTCARRSPTSPPNEPAIVTTLRARSSSSAAARRACSTYCGPP
jgi:2-methylcitrate dehydratase PrpD